jgi:starch synthase (maltosyl-transferring)
MMAGTPNGIVMDAATGLIFSPSHFTWMDTNYPAGTPRQGYPIEIQALWQAALEATWAAWMRRKDRPAWQHLADQVRQSILDLFFRDELGYLSDCLHAGPGTPAKAAVADNALRPNQLFALTLGAVTDPNVAERVLFRLPGTDRSRGHPQPGRPPHRTGAAGLP